MAKTFKVGDKVRILDVDKIMYGKKYFTNGFVTSVVSVDSDGDIRVNAPNRQLPFLIGKSQFNAIELVDGVPTKKQRIKALESEVEALKYRIEALENGAIKNDETGRNYIASKMAEALKRHLEAEQQTPMSANQRRKAVIERAKAFVADVEKKAPKGCGKFDWYLTKPEYHINKEKRVVTVLVKGAINPKLYEKAIARCAPGDVFNEHIGKAIALAKAYGLDCPKEFTDAPQPEIAVGQYVNVKGNFGTYKDVVTLELGKNHSYEKLTNRGGLIAILDDTEAQYE